MKNKKIVIISVVFSACILSLVAVVLLILPGVHCYKQVKKECDLINYSASPYPYEKVTVPENYQTIEVGDLAVSIPESFEIDPEGMKQTYCGVERDELVLIQEMESLTIDFDEVDKTMSKRSWEKFFGKLGISIPRSHYEMRCACYAMNLDDFHLCGKPMKQFEIMAQMKQAYVLVYPKAYYYETDEYEGFVYMIKEPEEQKNNDYCYSVELWKKEDNNAGSYYILISSPDFEKVKTVISSIRQAEGSTESMRKEDTEAHESEKLGGEIAEEPGVDQYGQLNRYLEYDWVNCKDGLISFTSPQMNGPYFYMTVTDLNADTVPEVILSQHYSNRTAQINDIYSIVNNEVVFEASFYGMFDQTMKIYEDDITNRKYFLCSSEAYQNQTQTDSVIVCSYNEDFTDFTCEPFLSLNKKDETVTYRQYREPEKYGNCTETLSVWDFGENEELTDVITEKQYNEVYQDIFRDLHVVAHFPDLHTDDLVYNIFRDKELYDQNLCSDKETVTSELERVLKSYLKDE